MVAERLPLREAQHAWHVLMNAILKPLECCWFSKVISPPNSSTFKTQHTAKILVNTLSSPQACSNTVASTLWIILSTDLQGMHNYDPSPLHTCTPLHTHAHLSLPSPHTCTLVPPPPLPTHPTPTPLLTSLVPFFGFRMILRLRLTTTRGGGGACSTITLTLFIPPTTASHLHQLTGWDGHTAVGRRRRK